MSCNHCCRAPKIVCKIEKKPFPMERFLKSERLFCSVIPSPLFRQTMLAHRLGIIINITVTSTQFPTLPTYGGSTSGHLSCNCPPSFPTELSGSRVIRGYICLLTIASLLNKHFCGEQKRHLLVPQEAGGIMKVRSY